MRKLSHLRLLILLTVALNTLDHKLQQRGQLNLTKFQEDLLFCPQCFESQKVACENLMGNLIANTDHKSLLEHLFALLPQRSCKRNNQLYGLKEKGGETSTQQVLAKYFANSKEHLEWKLQVEELKQLFLDAERLDGMQFWPLANIEDFVKLLMEYHRNLSPLAIWLYLLVNVQPLLMPWLFSWHFPVPQTHGICGFTIYQEYAGQDLYHFQNQPFLLRLKIAKHLLEACLKFSHGIATYRFYITDLTADNVVYSIHQDRLSFVDLDTLFVVDVRGAKYKSSTHRHEYIECPGCFAYSPEDIAAHNISDLNIYSACQFLSEDLYRDKTKGFLYAMPTESLAQKYPELWRTLQRCVDCPRESCADRFAVARQLLGEFEKVLSDNANKT